MKTKKGNRWDGKSRVSNTKYRERFNEIFGEKEEEDDEPKTRLEQMAKLKYDPITD
jgi:hypothetical protein